MRNEPQPNTFQENITTITINKLQIIKCFWERILQIQKIPLFVRRDILKSTKSNPLQGGYKKIACSMGVLISTLIKTRELIKLGH